MDYIKLSECTSVYILIIIYICIWYILVHLHGLPWWNRDETVTKKMEEDMNPHSN